MTTNAMKSKRPEPAEITYKNMRFLIMDRPTDASMDKFIEELKKRGAKDVVRVCEPTYKTDLLDLEGIRVLIHDLISDQEASKKHRCVPDWQFDDGSPPPTKIVEEWFNLLKSRFREEPGCCVAVHCVAGLGRAPVLVALALIECGLKYEDAVELIREKRRGAINAKQLSFLEHYRPKSRLKTKSNGHKQCAVM